MIYAYILGWRNHTFGYFWAWKAEDSGSTGWTPISGKTCDRQPEASRCLGCSAWWAAGSRWCWAWLGCCLGFWNTRSKLSSDALIGATKRMKTSWALTPLSGVAQAVDHCGLADYPKLAVEDPVFCQLFLVTLVFWGHCRSQHPTWFTCLPAKSSMLWRGTLTLQITFLPCIGRLHSQIKSKSKTWPQTPFFEMFWATDLSQFPVTWYNKPCTSVGCS